MNSSISRADVALNVPVQMEKTAKGRSCAHTDVAKVHDKFGEIDRNLTMGYCLAQALAAKANPLAASQARFGKDLAELGSLDAWPSELWPRHHAADKISIEIKPATSSRPQVIHLTSSGFHVDYTVMARGIFLPIGGGKQLLLWRDAAGQTS